MSDIRTTFWNMIGINGLEKVCPDIMRDYNVSLWHSEDHTQGRIHITDTKMAGGLREVFVDFIPSYEHEPFAIEADALQQAVVWLEERGGTTRFGEVARAGIDALLAEIRGET